MTHPSKVIVYQVTNLKNNKIYIGSTTRGLKLTKCFHKSASIKDSHRNKDGDSRPIYKAIKKYGFYNFMYNTMAEFESKKDAYEFKEVCVVEFNAMNPKYGYNCTTGSLNKGYKFNQETRGKMSESMKGKKMPESWKLWLKTQVKNNPDKYKVLTKGYKHTEEARRNMRLGQKNSNFVQTDEMKKRKSETMKKHWKNPTEKMLQDSYNKKHQIGSRDIRGKKNPMYGKGMKGKDNPMYGRTGKLNPNYGIPITKEHKKKIQEGKEKYWEKRKKEALARTEKKCNHCNQILDLSMFYKSKKSLDGLCHHCKDCDKKRKERYDTSK